MTDKTTPLPLEGVWEVVVSLVAAVAYVAFAPLIVYSWFEIQCWRRRGYFS